MQSRTSVCGLLALLTAARLATVSGVDVDIKFAEGDKSGEEGDTLEVVIIIEPPITAPNSVTIHVRSQTAFPDATLDPAEESDFSFNDANITLDSTSGDRLILQFNLTDDDILEAEESFFITMEFVDENVDGFSMSRSRTELIIQHDNSDKPTITLVRGDGSTDPVFLGEDAGNVTNAVKLVKTGDSEIDINVHIFDDRIKADASDFELQSLVITIEAAETEVFIPIQIIEDDKVEGDEQFGITILRGSPDYYEYGRSLTATIVDNDPLAIGFVDPLNQTSSEGGNSTICVDFIKNSLSRVTVKVSRTGGNATGDQYKLDRTLPFTLRLFRRSCFTMDVVDDEKLEWPRNVIFEVELIDTNNLWEVSPGRDVATITIEDNDGTPLQPVITNAELLEKVLKIEWDSKETPLQRTDDFTVTVIIQSNNDTQSDFFGSTTTNTKHTFNNVDPNYEVVVCSRNKFGENCTLPFPVTRVSTPTTEPQLALKLQFSTIAIIAAVGGVFLLLCCLLLFLFLCCWCSSDSGQSYYPEKREKKHAEDFSRYRACTEDNESSLNFYD